MRGGEKVLELIARDFPGAPIHTLFHFRGSVSPELEAHPIHTSYLQHVPLAKGHYRSYLPFFPKAIENFDLAKFDLVLSTSHCVAKGVIVPHGARHICYCHTPMRYAWDQEKVYFPDDRGPVAWLRRRVLARLRRWDVASASRVDTFIANSTHVAKRIERYYGRSAEVIHPPIDTDFFTLGAGASGDYCLAVGAAVPYKRLDLAVAACRQLGIELRIVGGGPAAQELADRGGTTTRVLGRVSDEELRDLYRGARCYLLPGVEDFGMGTVEALACGTPVVALAAGGVLDVVADGRHGVFFREEGDHRALALAIDKLGKMRLDREGLRNRAEDFSVQRFVSDFRSVLDREFAAAESAPEGSLD
jgi:glycosyltransferase involved in cell wall biosynthesis